MANGLLDLAIVTADLDQHDAAVQKETKQVLLHSFRDVVIAGKSYRHLLRGKKTISLSELADYPLISLWHESETFELYSRLYAKYGLDYTPSIEAGTASQVLVFAASEMGYGFLAKERADHAIADRKIIELPVCEELPLRNIVLLSSEIGGRNPATVQLEKSIRSLSS